MTTTNKHRKETINLRLHSEDKSVIERAANLEGKTVSSFIISSALAGAKKIIQGHEPITLNAKESKAFLNALARPPRFNDALIKAFELHGQRINGK